MSHSPNQRKRFVKWRIDLAIHEALAIACKQSIYFEFHRLLKVVSSRSQMLRSQPISGKAGWPHVDFLRAFLALAQHHRNWQRDAEDWIPSEDGLHRQFASLARHLLATHPVPGFMTNVWFEEPSPMAVKHQKLFKHLGLGNSIRGADLPIPMTKRMAQFFGDAPDHFSVEEALRWSQVLGLGGDKDLAMDIIATRLGRIFECEEFWTKVIRFLVHRPLGDRAMIAPFIDYLNLKLGQFFSHRFHRMTDRQLEQLLSDVRTWMAGSPLYGRRPRLRWKKTGIGGFRHVEPKDNEWSFRYWTIRELSTSQELIEEGNALHHCVGGYAFRCVKGRSSIWSLQAHGSLETHRVLTIEVDPATRRIVTALGNCNSSPDAEARQVMEMWAEQEELEIGSWV